MADVSDPRIAEAYAEVRKDNGANNWFLLGYENNKKIVFLNSGSGGVDELASNLSADGCYYGYVRVVNKDDETTRTKFAFVTFKGDNAPVMRKGNMSVHIGDVKKVIKDYNIEISGSEPGEISEEAVIKKIKAANY